MERYGGIHPDKIMCMKVGDYNGEEDPDKLTDSQMEVWEWITETNDRRDFRYADIKQVLDAGRFSFKESTLKKTLAFFCKCGKLKHEGDTRLAKYVVQQELQDELLQVDEEVIEDE